MPNEQKKLKDMTFAELRQVMIDRYDGNAGEIINGFQEMGLKGNRLTAAMVRYLERNPVE
jgi:hypothetical protein